MNQRHDLLAISLLIFAAAIVALTGVSGPLLSENQSKGMYEILKDWQTLIGVLVAVAIGYVAVLPVWRQVRIMSSQAAIQMLPVIYAEANELDRDRGTLDKIRDVQFGLSTAEMFCNLDRGDGHPFVSEAVKHLGETKAQIEAMKDELERFQKRVGLSNREFTYRLVLCMVLTTFRISMQNVYDIVGDRVDNYTLEPAEVDKIRKFASDYLENVERRLKKAEEEHTKSRQDVHRRVVELRGISNAWR